ncbi:MAG: hypothetical protein O7I42_00115 [Alphaproteobacteria bacterium]|nr:hypothetical protein [Alphaproteobacteria bacterium]
MFGIDVLQRGDDVSGIYHHQFTVDQYGHLDPSVDRYEEVVVGKVKPVQGFVF